MSSSATTQQCTCINDSVCEIIRRISSFENMDFFFLTVLLQHTETTGTSKTPQTCVGLISWALQQSAQIDFSSFDAPLCKVSQRRSNGFVGIHIYRNRDSLAFTCNVLTAQVVSENGRWQ
uniref:Uncharacterized protein n=1 Tax=Takifugu rubripes TaxID=31033 RepID=A0A674PBY9_TAKRU